MVLTMSSHHLYHDVLALRSHCLNHRHSTDTPYRWSSRSCTERDERSGTETESSWSSHRFSLSGNRWTTAAPGANGCAGSELNYSRRTSLEEDVDTVVNRGCKIASTKPSHLTDSRALGVLDRKDATGSTVSIQNHTWLTSGRKNGKQDIKVNKFLEGHVFQIVCDHAEDMDGNLRSTSHVAMFDNIFTKINFRFGFFNAKRTTQINLPPLCRRRVINAGSNFMVDVSKLRKSLLKLQTSAGTQ